MRELKKCKKHDQFPYLKEITPDPLQKYQYGYIGGNQHRYVCASCEQEKERERVQPLIDEWNKEQENK